VWAVGGVDRKLVVEHVGRGEVGGQQTTRILVVSGRPRAQTRCGATKVNRSFHERAPGRALRETG
jgi:hypothetical protein